MMNKINMIISWPAFFLCMMMELVGCLLMHSSNGIIQEVLIDSKFECDASHLLKSKATTEIQCVHKCARNEKCEILNYNHQWNEKEINCEIYSLSKYDSSCKTVPNQNGWKAAIYKDTERCRYLIYNNCYPCNCPKTNCLKDESSLCQCLGDSPPLPIFFISFESALSFDRGADKRGNSIATLKKDANVGTSEGRAGNVLRLTGIDPSAIIGSFDSHPLNNPNTGSSTISFWIKVVSAAIATQTVFGTGKMGSNTGILMQLKDFGKTIYTEGITSMRYGTLTFNVGDTLRQWTHIALVERGGSGASLKLYVNGIMVAISGALKDLAVSTSGYIHLSFGVDDQLFTLKGDSYGLHIDDVTYWSKVLTDAEIREVKSKALLLLKGREPSRMHLARLLPAFRTHFD